MGRFHYLFFIVSLFVMKSYGGITENRNENLIVETKIGSIRGLRADDGNYIMFMGIPYAKINETNIFGDSIQQEPFDEVFDAFDDSSICPQREEFNFTIVGSLDCLNLNIYVPDSASAQNLLPTMVYIYGGGFNIGFAGRFLYGPKYIVRHDVIMVTLNYRTGPYGFMCLDIPEVSGNAGLKDQVLALRWLQNNIEAFGGDPNKVTLFGNSAGGISNGLHLASETEKLFTNIILQSSSMFYPGLGSNPDYNAPISMAAALNFETDNIREALSFLSMADVHSVIQAASGMPLGPCVEKDFPGVEKFLAELPINLKHLKKANGVNILLGYTNKEMLVSFPEDAGPSDWEIWETSINSLLQLSFNFNETQMSETRELIRRFYFGDEEINNNMRLPALNLLSDFIFVYPVIRSIEPYLEAGVEKIYQYLFSYYGNRNFVKIKDNITASGAAHADEIGYQFKMDYIPEEPTEADQLIIDRVTTMWTNFAKYNDPTPETNSLLPVKWEPISKGAPYHYIDINTEMTAHMRYETRRMTFWEMFYKTYGQYELGYIDPNSVPDSSGSASFHPILLLIVLVYNVLNLI